MTDSEKVVILFEEIHKGKIIIEEYMRDAGVRPRKLDELSGHWFDLYSTIFTSKA